MFNFNKDNFSIMFRALYTLLVSVWVGLYVWQITFRPADEISRYAEFILGFIFGTLISTLVNFYFGGADNAEKKPDTPTPNSTPSTDSVQPKHVETLSKYDT